MKNKESLTNMYITLFDKLPPLLETKDYEEPFYQELMLDAIINEKPITDEDIENKLKETKGQYDYVEDLDMQDMEYQKIRKLLKEYGARDEEIENFMQDLGEVKEETKGGYDLITNADKLKLTEEGKDIIEKAPTMAKEELEKTIKTYLEKQ